MREQLNSKNQSYKTNLEEFFSKSAKAWQSYISYEFIKGIELSGTQKRVLNTEGKQIVIKGSAGSGKSIVLLYKLIKAMKEEKEPRKFLYMTYNQTLIDDIRKRAKLSTEYKKYAAIHQVDICTFHDYASRTLKGMGFDVSSMWVNYSKVEKKRGNAYRRVAGLLSNYIKDGDKYDEIPKEERLFKSHDIEFIRDEILWMKSNGFIMKDKYMECGRAGRGNIPRLTKAQRNTVFKIFQDYRRTARDGKWGDNILDLEDYAILLHEKFEEIPEKYKYDFLFVDEVQDFDAMQLQFLISMSPKLLVLAEDPKQKIYKRSPHSYISMGIDMQNNSRTLNENYRSTAEIMKLANSLDFEDSIKDSSRIRYINNGPKPKVNLFKKFDKSLDYIGERIKAIHSENPKYTIAIIDREEEAKSVGNKSPIKQYLGRFASIMDIEKYGKSFEFNKDKQVVYTDLYNVKGLEFDYVFVLQFDRDHYPLSKEVETFEKYIKQDDREEIEHKEKAGKDFQEMINREKKRLYVAMSRAKKELEIFCVGESEKSLSPFFNDFKKGDYEFKFRKR